MFTARYGLCIASASVISLSVQSNAPDGDCELPVTVTLFTIAFAQTPSDVI